MGIGEKKKEKKKKRWDGSRWWGVWEKRGVSGVVGEYEERWERRDKRKRKINENIIIIIIIIIIIKSNSDKIK